MIWIPIDDRATVELLHAMQQGKKTQPELVARLRDYRRLKQGLSFIERLEMELRISFGLCKVKSIPIQVPEGTSINILKRSYGTSNGKKVKCYERNHYLRIIDINMENGKALIAIDEEALREDG